MNRPTSGTRELHRTGTRNTPIRRTRTAYRGTRDIEAPAAATRRQRDTRAHDRSHVSARRHARPLEPTTTGRGGRIPIALTAGALSACPVFLPPRAWRGFHPGVARARGRTRSEEVRPNVMRTPMRRRPCPAAVGEVSDIGRTPPPDSTPAHTYDTEPRFCRCYEIAGTVTPTALADVVQRP